MMPLCFICSPAAFATLGLAIYLLGAKYLFA